MEKETVSIPFANQELLIKLKQTHRDKDKQDLQFLQQLICSNQNNK